MNGVRAFNVQTQVEQFGMDMGDMENDIKITHISEYCWYLLCN
jgi:hypothetical protein